MRRFLVLFFVLLSAPLVLAAGPAVTLAPPTVIVYPFTLNGSSVNKESSSRLADIVANQMAAAGGLVVKPPVAGIERQDYLTNARKLAANYYVSGYITPLGDDVTVVEQVVSTQTGIVVFSNTAQLRTYQDAAGQGDILADAILRHHRRNLEAYAAAPPPPAPSPSPEGAGNEANLGKLFGKRKQARATPAATGSPTARPVAAAAPAPAPPVTAPAPAVTATPAPALPIAPAAAAKTYAVTAVGGNAPADQRESATRALIAAVNAQGGRATAVAVPADDLPAGAAAACNAGPASTVIAANLNTHTEMEFGTAQITATLDFAAYTCSGARLYRMTFERGAGTDPKIAIDRAVGAATGVFLRRVKPTR